MAKYIKSFFQTAPDNRKNSQCGTENDGDVSDLTPHLTGRRKLSISRSGRLKQTNKKRHSISLEIYGANFQCTENPKTVEYHVNTPNFQCTENPKTVEYHVNTPVSQTIKTPDLNNEDKVQRRHSTDMRTPEEEIDIAFNIIDKI